MARRRNKNRRKGKYFGMNKTLRITSETVENALNKELILNQNLDTNAGEVGGIPDGIKSTESMVLENNYSGNENNCKENTDVIIKKGSKTLARKLSATETKKMDIKHVAGEKVNSAVDINPKKVDGDTCIDVTCGKNEAILCLSKLCMGSKGACIFFSNSWLTPNEFQTISGRETAKYWKRSIKHNGHSLKLLIARGLVNVPLKSSKNVTDVVDCERQLTNDINISPKGAQMSSITLKNGVVGNDTVTAITPNPDIAATEDNNKGGIQDGQKGSKRWKNESKYKTAKEKPPKRLAKIGNTGVSKKKFTNDLKRTCVDNSTCNGKMCIPTNASVPDGSSVEEERRFDEFVKTLKLTKVTDSKSDQVFSAVDEIDDAHQDINYKEPEMPVLKKEVDAERGCVAASKYMNEHISTDMTEKANNFHATVTPPPTPPGDDNMMGTFKSNLIADSNSIKITINREKQNKETENGTGYKSSDVATSETEADSNIQSVLLQDALQSAKLYKEKLKPPHVSPIITNIPTGTTHTVSSKSTKDMISPQTASSSLDIPNAHHSSSAPSTSTTSASKTHKTSVSTSSALSWTTSMSSCSTTASMPAIPEISRSHRKVRRNDKLDDDKFYNPYHLGHIPLQRGITNSLPAMDFNQTLSGMTFRDLVSVLSSIYGPLPFPVDSKDSAFLALQEFHRRHNIDMLRLVTQGQINGSPSSVLYPMMTQQILLSMTQQFYSMPESGDWLPSTKSPVETHHTAHRSENHSSKKRKLDAADHVLDLSLKRPKSDTTLSSKSSSYSSIIDNDAPLDFSMKRLGNACHKSNDKINKRPSNKTNGVNDLMSRCDDLRYKAIPICSTTRPFQPVCSCAQHAEGDIKNWSVEQVCSFLQTLEGCGSYAKIFREQGISGKLLPYLTTQHLTCTFGMGVGPALALIQAVRDNQERNIPLSIRHNQCSVHSGYGFQISI